MATRVRSTIAARKLPFKTVKVGPHDYKIRLIPKIGQGGHVGITHFQEKLIQVAKGLPPKFFAETLWHEIKHAIWYEWGLDSFEFEKSGVSYACEEDVVTCLSVGELCVLRDNPKFKTWLFKQV